MPPAILKRELQARRKSIALVILLAGCAVGLVVYFTAPPASDDVADQLTQTKQYQREMETYGGPVNELASRMREWFDGLWRGPTLGITVGCLAALLAAIAYLALTPIPGALDRYDEPPRRR